MRCAAGTGPACGRGEDNERVVSVSIPIQHVQAVLGVLTLEANDVDAIIARERLALIPFILIAIGVTLSSSLLLTRLIAQPVLRLARAADRVRLAGARAISLPDLARRDDELGDLTRSLEAMTDSLSERMDAIESFAADVAHEIKNPLTSLRSAVETLDLVTDPAARDRLLGILKNDVKRLDRLVTDISNASRLDAELSRDQPKAIDLGRLVGDIVALYHATAKPGDVTVRYYPPAGLDAVTVSGREGPLGQVFRNLIDNARSFSPPGGEVAVAVQRAMGRVIATVADLRPGHPAREPGDGVRAVLHLAAEGGGVRRQLGPRPFDRAADRRGARRHAAGQEPHDRRRQGGRRPLPADAAGSQALSAEAGGIVHAGLIARRGFGGWRGVLIEGGVRRRQERPGAAGPGRGLPAGGRRPGDPVDLRRAPVRPRAGRAAGHAGGSRPAGYSPARARDVAGRARGPRRAGRAHPSVAIGGNTRDLDAAS